MAHAMSHLTRPVAIREITPELVTERLSYRLRRMIGTGQRWSYSGAAARTGIDVRTLKAYVQGTACPNLVKYKRLLAVLGPEIGHELNAMQGWLPRTDAVPPEALDLFELREETRRAADIIGCVLSRGRGARDAPRGVASVARLYPPVAPRDGPDGEAAEPEMIDTLPEFRTPLKVEDITTEAIARRLGFRLRILVGSGRSWRLAEVATATGIDQRTLQSYVEGGALPNLARYYRLEHLFGPELGIELARMLGWEPRYGHPARIARASLEALKRTLDDASDVIDALVEGGDGARLIRRDDRLANEPPRLARPGGIVAAE